MGVEPPFLYDPPSRYSFAGPTDKGFNPKAATQASWTPAPPKPKKDGPLIEFNKHPDSYLLVPYGQLNVQPMNPNTRSKVLKARRFQLFLRVCELLGALGGLFCVIAINNTTATIGWIIRIAPAVLIVHSLYGVYHLCRSPTGRTPGSTASYMVFASMVDTGLLPFLVFSALLSHGDYTANAYGWSTLFPSSAQSYKIIYSFFLISMVEGSLLVLSLIVGIYLALLFRKIAKLPPDMNPLEPNLTARPHKRNKSELTSSEKHLSGSTIGSNNNLLSKTADSSIAPARRVPFMHTRTDSADSVTLYESSLRGSRADLSSKDQFFEYENKSIHDGTDYSLSKSPSRPQSAISPSTNSRPAGSGFHHRPTRSSALAQEPRNSWLSYNDQDGEPTPLSHEAENRLEENIRALSPVSVLSQPEVPYSGRLENDDPQLYSEIRGWYETPHVGNTQQTYGSTHAFGQNQAPQPSYLHESGPKKRSRDPLGMNPPSPYFNQENTYQTQDPDRTPMTEPRRYALHDADVNLPDRSQQNSRNSSFIGSGGKSRFYGNLRNSIGSINRNNEPKYGGSDSSSDYERTKSDLSSYTNVEIHEAENAEYIHYGNAAITEVNSHQESWWKGNGRNVSNSTGYDLRGGYAGLGAEFGKGMGRRRDVSGKIVEEGRSYGNEGVGGEHKLGAAGWARFKGM